MANAEPVPNVHAYKIIEPSVNVPKDTLAVRTRNVVPNVMVIVIVRPDDPPAFMASARIHATVLVALEPIVICVV